MKVGAEIKAKAFSLGIKNVTETLAEITGRSNASISARMNGVAPWTAAEIKAIRDAWNLSPMEVDVMFIECA